MAARAAKFHGFCPGPSHDWLQWKPHVLEEKNPNKLYFVFHTLAIFEENHDYYFKDIQDDLINAYNETNSNRKLIYNKNGQPFYYTKNGLGHWVQYSRPKPCSKTM